MENQTPLQPIDLNLLIGRDKYREWTKAGRQIYGVPYAKIEVRPGFNKRIKFGDLDELSDSILGAGLIEPLTLDALADGTFLLVDGERRFKAIGKLIDKGIPGFEFVEAHIINKKTTDYERYTLMVAKNNLGKPLEPLELGLAFKEMTLSINPATGKNYTAAEIGRSTGYHKMYVSNMLKLDGVSDEIKEHIKDGHVSPTAALEMEKKGMSNQEQLELIEQAQEKGEKPKVEDIRNSKSKKSAIDGWDKVKGEEVIVNKEELYKHLGRVFAMPVISAWVEDFIDEDTAEVVSIDRKECIIEAGTIFEDGHIDAIITSGTKVVRFEHLQLHGDNAPLDTDEIMSDANNAEADHQEKQDEGLFGALSKPKSPKLIDLCIETSVMLKGLEHQIELMLSEISIVNPRRSKISFNTKNQVAKITNHIAQIKATAEHLK